MKFFLQEGTDYNYIIVMVASVYTNYWEIAKNRVFLKASD
jgi:hypothetical protein